MFVTSRAASASNIGTFNDDDDDDRCNDDGGRTYDDRGHHHGTVNPGLEALLAAFRVRRCCYKLGPTDEAGDAASFHAREVSRVDGTLLSRTVGSAHKAIPQLPS